MNAVTGRASKTEPNLQNVSMRTPLGDEIRHIYSNIEKLVCGFRENA